MSTLRTLYASTLRAVLVGRGRGDGDGLHVWLPSPSPSASASANPRGHRAFAQDRLQHIDLARLRQVRLVALHDAIQHAVRVQLPERAGQVDGLLETKRSLGRVQVPLHPLYGLLLRPDRSLREQLPSLDEPVLPRHGVEVDPIGLDGLEHLGFRGGRILGGFVPIVQGHIHELAARKPLTHITPSSRGKRWAFFLSSPAAVDRWQLHKSTVGRVVGPMI
mmetsp:Transcript_16956/g.38256  ORF Transcript_16956/g.38256 Transcript_16956/m.38256 type:complete len:220 (+) Transcript_16956:4010-4669(+)